MDFGHHTIRAIDLRHCCLLAFLATAPLPAAAQQPAAERWPRTMTNDTGSAVVYQPQVIAWPERQRLETRIAIGLTPKGAKAPVREPF